MACGISHWCQRKGRLVVTSGRVYGRAARVREAQGRGSRSARAEPGSKNLIAGLGLQNIMSSMSWMSIVWRRNRKSRETNCGQK